MSVGELKRSFLMTVWNRDYEVLLATLRGLSRCNMAGSELIVVDDGSTMDYTGIRAYMDAKFESYQWIGVAPYESFQITGGFNNPARAFNTALLAASGRDVVVMSSDVIIGPKLVSRIDRFNLEETAWVPLVIDMDSGAQYCGPLRLFPMPWCFAANRQACLDVGGWDETYLKGMCYEDNDFVGRVVLKTGKFIGDWTVAAYHQSHRQQAYDVSDIGVLEANQRNKRYTKEKWSGIPFDPEYVPFDVIRKPWVTGDIVHECRYEGNLLEETIGRTVGLVSDARVKA